MLIFPFFEHWWRNRIDRKVLFQKNSQLKFAAENLLGS